MRAELESFWDKCFFGEDTRKDSLGYYDEDYTEESLEFHENELVTIKQYYEDNKDIFKVFCYVMINKD